MRADTSIHGGREVAGTKFLTWAIIVVTAGLLVAMTSEFTAKPTAQAQLVVQTTGHAADVVTGTCGCERAAGASFRHFLELHVVAPEEFDMGEDELPGRVVQRHAAVHAVFEIQGAVAPEVGARHLDIGIG